MKHLFLLLILVSLSSGCAMTEGYNPVSAATQQTFLLNETSFAQVKEGMKQSQIHQIMGDNLIVGYAYQNSPQASGDVKSKPLMIANPYKTEDLKLKDGNYLVEYYVHSVKQSDGVISDDELTPFIFHDGLLVGRGWDYLKALRLKNPS